MRKRQGGTLDDEGREDGDGHDYQMTDTQNFAEKYEMSPSQKVILD